MRVAIYTFNKNIYDIIKEVFIDLLANVVLISKKQEDEEKTIT